MQLVLEITAVVPPTPTAHGQGGEDPAEFQIMAAGGPEYMERGGNQTTETLLAASLIDFSAFQMVCSASVYVW